jgi:carbamoyltransferase
MQYVARCRELKTYPAIAHVDGTSRVQTVSREEHPGLHAVLENWEKATGRRVLLNTSLNSKGEPLVNTRAQALAFGERTGVRVLVPGMTGDHP